MRSLTTNAPLLSLALIVGLAALLAGCGAGGGSSNLTVAGYLADAGTLAPIPGATVSAEGKVAITGSDGSFALTGLTSSPVPLLAEAATYQSLATNVAVPGGAINVGALYLAPVHTPGTGNVTGHVTLSGSVVAGASVRVNGGTQTALTNPNGTFTIYNVPAGLQMLIAANGGFASGSANVTVMANSSVSAGTIALSIGPPPPPV